MRKILRQLAALATFALLSVGCVTPPVDSATGPTTAPPQPAVKFAECMRANGVGEFPDPDASGSLTIDAVANRGSIDTRGAAFERATVACRDLQPAGYTGHKRNAQEQANALTFAQCVRDHGVKDFPDPTPDGPLVDTTRIPSVASTGNGPVNAAMQQCREAAANAGVVRSQ